MAVYKDIRNSLYFFVKFQVRYYFFGVVKRKLNIILIYSISMKRMEEMNNVRFAKLPKV